MKRQDYKYADEPLSIIAAMDTLKTRYTKGEGIETGHSIKNLASFVEEDHVKNRGLPTDDPGRVVRRALFHLRQSGHAVEWIGGNFILLSDQRLFGKGEDWVYCYYLTSQKEQGAPRYPCTIGRTSGGTIKSVREYIGRQTRKAVVDPPKIPLLFRTYESVALEGAIHRILRLRDQQIEEAPGDELFMTNPEEVLEIYDFIIHGDPNWTTCTESRNEETAKKIRKRLLESRSDDNSEPKAEDPKNTKSTFNTKSRRPEKYKIYFQPLIDTLREEHAFTKARVAPCQNSYSFPSGITGITYIAWFREGGQTAVGVEIDQNSFKKSERLTFFDRLYREDDDGEIDARFNFRLSWERRPEKRFSYISMCRDGDIEASADELEAIRDWHVASLLKFKNVFQPIIKKLLMS